MANNEAKIMMHLFHSMQKINIRTNRERVTHEFVLCCNEMYILSKGKYRITCHFIREKQCLNSLFLAARG